MLQPRVRHREVKSHAQVTQLGSDEAGLGARLGSWVHYAAWTVSSLGLVVLASPFIRYCAPSRALGPGASSPASQRRRPSQDDATGGVIMNHRGFYQTQT